jgi:hypothetical protein
VNRPDQPTLGTFRDALLRSAALKVRTTIPAKVIEYHDGPPTTAKIEISAQQVEQDRDGDRITRPAFVVDDVPVWQHGGTENYIRTPLTNGDTGVVFVCDRSIGSWRTDGQSHPPPAPWLHNLGEIVFMPGWRPDLEAFQPPLPSKGGMVFESMALQLGANAEQAAILGNMFAAMWNSLMSALTNHTHPTPSGLSSVSANLGLAIGLLPDISSVLSDKVFIE